MQGFDSYEVQKQKKSPLICDAESHRHALMTSPRPPTAPQPLHTPTHRMRAGGRIRPASAPRGSGATGPLDGHHGAAAMLTVHLLLPRLYALDNECDALANEQVG